ncbi:MAG: hypothetical protein IPM22_20825 [Betaproteobacteria bacterium]|nr:hypothetical protein [Betaproteobacteria bacterium]
MSYIHIGPGILATDATGPGNRRTRIVVVDHKRNGLTDEAYVAFSSRVGKQRYLNVVQGRRGHDRRVPLCPIHAGRPQHASFATMDEDALEAAIRAG